MTFAPVFAALRRHPFSIASVVLLVTLLRQRLVSRASVVLLMTVHRRHPFSLASSALLMTVLRRHPFSLGSTVLLVRLLRRRPYSLACAALVLRGLRQQPFSLACTALLVTVSAGLLGVPVPLALALWAIASLACLEIWHACEPFVLHRLGCRAPNRLECERLVPTLETAGLHLRVEAVDTSPSQRSTRLPDAICLQVVDAPQPWLGAGVRNVVVSQALLDVLDDRALVGLLTQATYQLRAASLPGELVVWIGNLPLVGVWCVGRGLGLLGRWLAIVVGASLVLPLVLWPAGWTRWVGRLFGAVFVGLLGSVLLSSRLAAPGLALLLAWVVVPGLVALLGWERRRAERRADDATTAAGLGWHLLEALETLAWSDSLIAPRRLLDALSARGAPIPDRADHLWQTLLGSGPGARANP